MKGRIVFWFNLLQPNFDVGIVTIKLFGQKCEMCKQDLYEQPMWYPEEVTKVCTRFTIKQTDRLKQNPNNKKLNNFLFSFSSGVDEFIQPCWADILWL